MKSLDCAHKLCKLRAEEPPVEEFPILTPPDTPTHTPVDTPPTE